MILCFFPLCSFRLVRSVRFGWGFCFKFFVLINCHLKNISCLFLSIVNYCVLNGWMMMMIIGQPFSSSSFLSLLFLDWRLIRHNFRFRYLRNGQYLYVIASLSFIYFHAVRFLFYYIQIDSFWLITILLMMNS